MNGMSIFSLMRIRLKQATFIQSLAVARSERHNTWCTASCIPSDGQSMEINAKEMRALWEVTLPGRRMEGTQMCDHQFSRRKTQEWPSAWELSLSVPPFMLYTNTIRPIAALKVQKVRAQKKRPPWPVVSAVRETRYKGITWAVFTPRLATVMMDWLLAT